MNMPKIQADERGITVNKSLAWTIVTGLLAFGLYAGVKQGSIETTQEGFQKAIDAERIITNAFRGAVNTRLTQLEVSRAGDIGEMNSLRRDINDLKIDIKGLSELIQERIPR